MLLLQKIILLFILCFVKGSIMPEQVHISLGDNTASDIVITWLTFNSTEESIVSYGETQEVTKVARGGSSSFMDGGTLHIVRFIHRVPLHNLEPNTLYYYRCGDKKSGWSKLYHFKTLPNGSNWSARFAIYGDLGYVNRQSVPRLIKDVSKNLYDVILHLGDMAYNLDTDNGNYGDMFMRAIEPIAAQVPYMTIPGNHENGFNFLHYRKRMSMPGNTENIYYSFNVGPIHFVSFSTELYFYIYYGIEPIIEQWEWLKKDLMDANLPENRAVRPWIVAMGHRPMYCSNNDNDDCTKKYSIIREGAPIFHILGLESLFYEQGVDLCLWAHEHSYERLWPVYNRKVCNGSLEEPYKNPNAPIHLVTGSAGCQERIDNFSNKTAPWSAMRIADYGYTRLHALNGTHLHLQQVSDDKGGDIVDDFWIVKDKRTAYSCH